MYNVTYLPCGSNAMFVERCDVVCVNKFYVLQKKFNAEARVHQRWLIKTPV